MYTVHAQPNILLNNFVCRSENYSELDLLSRQLNDLIIKKDAIIGTAQKAADIQTQFQDKYYYFIIRMLLNNIYTVRRDL